jgi:death-on-curing protein
MSKIQLPSVEMIIDLHDRVVAQTGGAPGIRSIDAIAGAWGRTESRKFYEPDMTVPAAAATLSMSVAKAHGFADGNKRAAYGAMSMVLSMNGYALTADPAAAVEAIVGAAAGDGDTEKLQAWVTAHAAPDPIYQSLFDYDLSGPEVSP